MDKNYLKAMEYLINELINYSRDIAGISVEAYDVLDWFLSALEHGNIKYEKKDGVYIINGVCVSYDRDGIYVHED